MPPRVRLSLAVGVFLVSAAALFLRTSDPTFADAKANEAKPPDWADAELPVRAGLDLWLDATRLPAAYKAATKNDLAPDTKLETWYDASGHNRHLLQKEVEGRPQFVALPNGYKAVRFDGVQQALALGGLDRGYRELTLFIVAAPFSNRGDFRALLALNQTDKNDYQSGVTIDFGPENSPKFQSLNVEGPGFGGAVNLLKDASNFGAARRLCVTSAVGAGGVKLFIDGKAQGQRDRTDSTLRMDQITVGARFYNNGGLPNRRGFLDGDVVEVLLFDRVLSDKERGQVEGYLESKHDKFRQIEAPKRTTVGKPLAAVADPPAVQMFVAGFSVQPLPVELTNINNVQYRPDGKLVALAYDGNVYLLSDTDNDGLEDKVELIWDNKGRIRAPIGMALTPPGYKHGDGLIVASKGKCSLLVDGQQTGKLDKEIVVADGWKEIPHGVDALGVAIDPTDHSIYFGLGTTDYTNAYQVKDGKGQYKLASERGAVLRVAPDLKSREIVATGIRFPVGIRFNGTGDLFCTDQEGATWLSNGNPFDELLHIEKSRHYGFPPRHPQHLPKVIDEPSVFDYGPQHQCTCGLNFNEPVNKGPIFGPDWWRADVFVTGYSRGKLYRTKLVKTAGGYVAQNQLLAALTMLPVDACVSPTGDLVVAVHGGAPDWGNGPNGKGKLYKIRYTGKQLPQPVFAYAQGPREVRIAFDRPLEPEHVRDLTGKIGIDYGKYVSAGDRFESQRPGYKVVVDQLATPRFDLPVLGVAVSQDRRALILQTGQHPEAGGYALTIPGLGRTTKTELKNEVSQRAETDLRYDLCGVEATWQGEKNSVWTGWMPHLDAVAARRFTAASADHDDLWTRLGQPGKLTLRTQLNLTDMLRPAVQVGSQIGYEWPAEKVTLVFRSKADFLVKAPPGALKTTEEEGFHVAALTLEPKRDEPIPVEITLTTTGGPFDLSVSYYTQEDPRPRALQLHRFLLPWAKLKPETTSVVQEVPELKGGNWARGRRVFFSQEASCSRCHTFNGEGGKIGPDLSNLPQRDYHSVLRDIVEPSLAINPDYITQVVALKDGRVFTGVVRTQGESLAIGDAAGNVTVVKRDQIEELTSSPLSIMPEGLPKQLGPEKMRDLLTFLLTEPPHLTDYGKDAPPPPRTWKEVQAILAGAPEPPAKTRPLRIVLVASKKDHGPGEHDYPAWLGVWKRLLALAEDVAVSTANDWPSADDFKSADVIVFYQQGRWTPDRAEAVDAYLARGGGLVYIHYAVDGGADAPGFAQRIGLAWRGGESKFRHGPLDLGFETGARHPIGRNFTKVHFHDESYWQLVGDPKKIELLASGVEEDKAQPLFWTLEPSKGRVFVSIPGHYSWTFDDPLFRVLLLRGIAWTAREPVDRFNELVPVGANVKREASEK